MNSLLNRILFFSACGSTTLGLSAQSDVLASQNTLVKWIETEKVISSERNEWAVEKAVVTSSIEFMQGEITRLEEVIKASKETASAGERKRAELQAEQERLQAVSDALADVVGGYETSIQKLAKGWPDAFLSMIRVPLDRIPEADEAGKAALTMRLQNVIVILSQYDKFNSVVTKDKGVQEIEGTSREVTTLYYGSAFAYFVDGSGSYAGYGFPKTSGDGWDWVVDPSLSATISELVAVLDQTTEAKFLALPAKITTP